MHDLLTNQGTHSLYWVGGYRVHECTLYMCTNQETQLYGGYMGTGVRTCTCVEKNMYMYVCQ